ncbi:MAG: hypothetical protein HUU17_00940 [Chthonomonadales bacterium]|nr:hypothetical protein [Chthonomonadales bacterium]
MGEVNYRSILFLLGISTLLTGLIGLSETLMPSKTALDAGTTVIRFFGPVLIGLGVVLIGLGRKVSKKARPSPRALLLSGLISMASPGMIWFAGSKLASIDSALWAPMVAAATLLLALPGVGLTLGGLRRIGQTRPAEPPPLPAPKVRRRR